MALTVSTSNNSKLKSAMLAGLAGTAGATLLALGGGQVTAHADTVVDANHVQVESGDTLSKIAQEHNTTVDQLAKDNNISDVNMIHVGDTLTLSGGAQVEVPQTNTGNTGAVQQATQNTAYTGGNGQGQSQGAQASTTSANAGSSAGYTSNVSGSEQAAKDWIAQRESGGSYTARNGQYVGRYQLSSAYLNGDYSPANQERVADQYCAQRYGSWQAAQAHWIANGWW